MKLLVERLSEDRYVTCPTTGLAAMSPNAQ